MAEDRGGQTGDIGTRTVDGHVAAAGVQRGEGGPAIGGRGRATLLGDIDASRRDYGGRAGQDSASNYASAKRAWNGDVLHGVRGPSGSSDVVPDSSSDLGNEAVKAVIHVDKEPDQSPQVLTRRQVARKSVFADSNGILRSRYDGRKVVLDKNCYWILSSDSTEDSCAADESAEWDNSEESQSDESGGGSGQPTGG